MHDPKSVAGKRLPVEADVSLLVIGAGPAGIAAALEAARHGVGVTLVDEHPLDPGLIGLDVPLHFGGCAGAGVQNRGRLLEQVVAATPGLEEAFEQGIDVRLGVACWGLFANGPSVRWLPGVVAGLTDGERAWHVRCGQVIVAAGLAQFGARLHGLGAARRGGGGGGAAAARPLRRLRRAAARRPGLGRGGARPGADGARPRARGRGGGRGRRAAAGDGRAGGGADRSRRADPDPDDGRRGARRRGPGRGRAPRVVGRGWGAGAGLRYRRARDRRRAGGRADRRGGRHGGAQGRAWRLGARARRGPADLNSRRAGRRRLRRRSRRQDARCGDRSRGGPDRGARRGAGAESGGDALTPALSHRSRDGRGSNIRHRSPSRRLGGGERRRVGAGRAGLPVRGGELPRAAGRQGAALLGGRSGEGGRRGRAGAAAGGGAGRPGPRQAPDPRRHGPLPGAALPRAGHGAAGRRGGRAARRGAAGDLPRAGPAAAAAACWPSGTSRRRWARAGRSGSASRRMWIPHWQFGPDGLPLPGAEEALP